MKKESYSMTRKLQFRLFTSILGLLALAVTFAASNAAAAAANTATVTITAVGKKEMQPPEIKKDDAQVYKGKEHLQLADWRRGETLFLAILIDDSLESSIANQWGDLKEFIMSQPDSTLVAVAYTRNGTATVAQDFTKDHALAAKALRIPLGDAGAFSSPYLSLLDWMKRWPDSSERKSIIMFSSGIDYFHGDFSPVDVDLDSTVQRAQKQNINIWTIYAPDAGHFGRRTFRAFNAQSNMSRLSDETGAESYYLGLGVPVTLKPYFDEIHMHLDNQYLATIGGSGGKKGNFQSVRVHTELPNVTFLAPSAVYFPPAQ
jgi:hypothetical protein